MKTVHKQLAALLGAHFFADMVSGLLAGFLPAALTHFHLDLSLGVILLSSLGIGSNFLQVPAAKLGARKTGPGALICGLILCGAFVLLGILPGSTPLWGLCLVMFVVGIGVAMVHPQGLRGIQALQGINPAVSTPFFMVGGFFGYSISPLAGGLLVEHFGLHGLCWILPLLLILVAGILLTHVRVAADAPEKGPAKTVSGPRPEWSFARMLWMAFFLNSGTLVISSLVPTMLHGKGFSLGFGGFSAMLFGLGSSCGSLLTGFLCRKRRAEFFIRIGLGTGIPAGLLYMLLCDSAPAAGLLFLAGFGLASGFPQLVAMTRTVSSRFSSSTRLGLMVGGTWGAAGIAFLLTGPLSGLFGIRPVLTGGVLLYTVTFLLSLQGSRRDSRADTTC